MRSNDDTPRIPLIVIRVEVPTTSVEEFVAHYNRYFGVDVVFIPAESRQPPGRRVRFVFALADGTELVAGQGMVIRTRRDTYGEQRPPGMELRYQCLDEASQQLIDRLLLARTRGVSSRPDRPPLVSMWLDHEETRETRPPRARPVRASALPANPFAEVPLGALSYFVDWAMARNTDPGRSSREQAEFARVKMRPPPLERRRLAGLAAMLAVACVLVGVALVMRWADRRAGGGALSAWLGWTSATSLPGLATAAVGTRAHTPPSASGEASAAAAIAPAMSRDAHLGLPRAAGRPILPTLPLRIAVEEAPSRMADAASAERLELVSPPPVTRSVLVIVSTPPGTVTIDGEPGGRTPLTTVVAPGSHEVVVKRPHYLPATTQVEGGGGRIELELQRPPATLHVTSAPPGAAVRVDGSPAGQTPLDVTVTAYKHHRVDIEHDGAIVRRTVYLRPPSGAIDVALRAARP